MDDKVTERSAEVLLLAKIDESQPLAAYSALSVQLVALAMYFILCQMLLYFCNFWRMCSAALFFLKISLLNNAVYNLIALPPHWVVWECLIQLCNVFWNTLLLWT